MLGVIGAKYHKILNVGHMSFETNKLELEINRMWQVGQNDEEMWFASTATSCSCHAVDYDWCLPLVRTWQGNEQNLIRITNELAVRTLGLFGTFGHVTFQKNE